MEVAVAGYGPEILKLQRSLLRDEELARDAFSAFTESLLTNLTGFKWECSFRTWAYRVARNTCYRFRHSPAAREQPVSEGALPDRAQSERSRTRPWLRTDVKFRFRALRERLAPQEQLLLLLRVDRKLSWKEVAQVMAGPDEVLDPDAIEQRAAALRQQFQRLKEHLRELAREQALLSSESPRAIH